MKHQLNVLVDSPKSEIVLLHGPYKRHLRLAPAPIVPTSFVCSLSGFFQNLGSDIWFPIRRNSIFIQQILITFVKLGRDTIVVGPQG